MRVLEEGGVDCEEENEAIGLELEEARVVVVLLVLLVDREDELMLLLLVDRDDTVLGALGTGKALVVDIEELPLGAILTTNE